MNTMDSFCLTTVSGDFTVDVGDFENGAVCSVVQIRKSRDGHEDIVKNETYVQAFGHEPERPSRKQQVVKQPPKIATPASLNTRAWIIRSSPESSELVSDPQFAEEHLHNLDEFRECLVLYALERAIPFAIWR